MTHTVRYHRVASKCGRSSPRLHHSNSNAASALQLLQPVMPVDDDLMGGYLRSYAVGLDRVEKHWKLPYRALPVQHPTAMGNDKHAHVSVIKPPDSGIFCTGNLAAAVCGPVKG